MQNTWYIYVHEVKGTQAQEVQIGDEVTVQTQKTYCKKYHNMYVQYLLVPTPSRRPSAPSQEFSPQVDLALLACVQVSFFWRSHHKSAGGDALVADEGLAIPHPQASTTDATVKTQKAASASYA